MIFLVVANTKQTRCLFCLIYYQNRHGKRINFIAHINLSAHEINLSSYEWNYTYLDTNRKTVLLKFI